MMYRIRLLVAAAGVLLVAQLPAFAEAATLDQATVLVDGVILREAPPEKWAFFVGSAGNPVDRLQKGQTIRVRQEMTIETLFRDTMWLEVEVLNPDGSASATPVTGWIYGGKPGADSKVLKKVP